MSVRSDNYSCASTTATLVHARRGVFDAKSTDPTRALVILALIGQLYDIERELREVCPLRGARTAL